LSMRHKDLQNNHICSITAPAIHDLVTLPLHDALPILGATRVRPDHLRSRDPRPRAWLRAGGGLLPRRGARAVLLRGCPPRAQGRSEEHTSELQSRENIVCRLLLEKKKSLLAGYNITKL